MACPARDTMPLAWCPAQGEKVGAIHGSDVVGGYLTVTARWFFPPAHRRDAQSTVSLLQPSASLHYSWVVPQPGRSSEKQSRRQGNLP